MSRTSRVVLPAPLHPARPITRMECQCEPPGIVPGGATKLGLPCGSKAPCLYQPRRGAIFPKLNGRLGDSAPHSERTAMGRAASGLGGLLWKVRDPAMGKVIGIDLGTTNSCVAVMEGAQP